MNYKIKLANRRAVGGLISLIGLVVVFSISSAAYLELNSSHSQLINNSVQINQKISDRSSESLNFTRTSTLGSPYDYDIDNLGSETVVLASYLVTNSDSVAKKQKIDLRISSGNTESLSISGAVDPNNDRILFITDLGKKCIISGNEAFRQC